MRVVSVAAEPFGGIEGQTLELGPGLNVVCGRNGKGKSTWHAALYAGLCGYVGGAGESDADEMLAEFRPWHRPDWAVSIVVELDTGERVRVDRDLTGERPDVTTGAPDQAAVSDQLSRDRAERAPASPAVASKESATDGVVDLSVAVGRDRRSFAVSSWIAQDRQSHEVSATADHRLGLADPQLGPAVDRLLGTADAELAAGRLEQARRDYTAAGVDPAAFGIAEAQQHLRDLQHKRDQLREAQAEVTRRRAEAATAHRAQLAADAALAKRVATATRNDLDALRRRLEPGTGYLYGPVPTSTDLEVQPAVAEARRELDEAYTARREPPPATPRPEPATPFTSGGEPARDGLGGMTPRPVTDVVTRPATQPPSVPATLARAGSLLQPVVLAAGVAVIGLVVIAVLWALGLGTAAVVAAVVTVAAIVVAGSLVVRGSVPSDGPPAPSEVDTNESPEPTGPPTALPQATPPPPAPAPPTALPPATPPPAPNATVERARERLAAALAERGMPAARPETAEEQFEVYRERCRLIASIRAKEADLAVATSRAAEAAAGLHPQEIEQYWWYDTAAVERVNRAWHQAGADLAEAERRLDEVGEDIDDGALQRAEEAVTEASQRQQRYDRLDRVLRVAEERLRSAREQVAGQLQAWVQADLRETLTSVTEEPGLRLDVDQNLRVRISPRRLRSYGLVDLAGVLTRIALGRYQTPEVELGPLFLDDVTSHIDEDRARRLLDLFRQVAQARQVVVFAHDRTTREWALAMAAQDPSVRALETTGVDRPIRPLS